MEAKLAKGDLAYLDYDVFIAGPGDQRTLHETTRANVAKAEGKFDEKHAYVPVPVVIGYDRVPKGLDEALHDAPVGESKEFVVPPEKGAGERDPRLVRLYPIREFHRKDIDPAPGMEVTVEGHRGTVAAVTAGRVRVDFNNPLAGRTLRYNVTVVRRADSREEKARAILDMDYGLAEQFRLFVKEHEIDVFVPDVCKTDERWFVAKFRVVGDLRELAGIPKVRFVEEYEKKVEEKKPEEAKAEPAAEVAPEIAEVEKATEEMPSPEPEGVVEATAEEALAEEPVAKPPRAKPPTKRKGEAKARKSSSPSRTSRKGGSPEATPEAEEKQPEEL